MDNDLVSSLAAFQSYQHARRDYQLTLPERFNLADAICKRHKDAVTRVALQDVKPAASNTYTFGGLDFLSDKFATALAENRITAGEVVAVILPPSARLIVAHLGALKLGATVASLALDFKAIACAVQASHASAIVVDYSRRDEIAGWVRHAPSLKVVFTAGDSRAAKSSSGDAKSFWMEIHRASADFKAVETSATAPAFIGYGVDAAGSLQSIAHTHAALLGQLAAFEMSQNIALADEAVFWVDGNWASSIELLSVVYPALWHGAAVVAKETLLSSADELFALMERYDITNACFTSQRLDALMRGVAHPRKQYESQLRTIVTNTASINGQHQAWANRALDAELNIAYGKPETGIIAASCARWFTVKPQSAGRIVPGRKVEIINARGDALPAGQTGHIAVHRTDAALSLETFKQREPTASRLIGDWCITDDTGYKDADDNLWIADSKS
jgi:acetyl-CoA synthetase